VTWGRFYRDPWVALGVADGTMLLWFWEELGKGILVVFTAKRKEKAAVDFVAEIEGLKERMAPPKRPNALVLAERNVSALKADHAALVEQHRLSAERDFQSDARRASEQTRVLAERRDELDEQLRTVRRELTEARAKAGAEFDRVLRPMISDFDALLHATINLVGEVIDIGGDAAYHANLAAIQSDLRLINSSPVLAAKLRELRAMVNEVGR
jgi:hypothetical protein